MKTETLKRILIAFVLTLAAMQHSNGATAPTIDPPTDQIIPVDLTSTSTDSKCTLTANGGTTDPPPLDCGWHTGDHPPKYVWTYSGPLTGTPASGQISSSLTLDTHLPGQDIVTVDAKQTWVDHTGSNSTDATSSASTPLKINDIVIEISDVKTNGFEPITNSNNTVIAGEQINLTVDVPGSDGSWASLITSYQWVLPSDAIASFNPEFSANPVTAFTPDDYTSNSITYYLQTGSDAYEPISCILTTASGKLVVTGKLYVECPTGSITASMDGVIIYPFPDDPTAERVQLGGALGQPSNTPNFAGIDITYAYQDPPDFTAQDVKCSQVVISENYSWTTGNINTANALDTSYIYSHQSVGDMWDSPNLESLIPAGSPYTGADTFRAYLMYRPALPNAIYIPVESLEWWWGFTATGTPGVGGAPATWTLSGTYHGNDGGGDWGEEPNWSSTTKSGH